MKRDRRRLRLLLVFLLLAAALLVAIDVSKQGSAGFGGVRGRTTSVLGTVQSAVSGAFGWIGDRIGSLGNSDHGQVAALRRENEALRQRMVRQDQQSARGAELDRLLRLAGAGQYRIVPAQVVGYRGGLGFEWTVTLDAGTGDGVQAGMTVINGDGLVGRVVSAQPRTCVVLLAIDTTSYVGARIAGSGEIGYTQGQGDGPLTLTVLGLSGTVKPGDRIVTAGTAGGYKPYVPGVPIGTVTTVTQSPGELKSVAAVTPFVRFTALDLVGVVVEPPRTDPRDAVLPPVPPAAPAPAAPAAPAPASPAPSAPATVGPTRPGASPSPSRSR